MKEKNGIVLYFTKIFGWQMLFGIIIGSLFYYFNIQNIANADIAKLKSYFIDNIIGVIFLIIILNFIWKGVLEGMRSGFEPYKDGLRVKLLQQLNSEEKDNQVVLSLRITEVVLEAIGIIIVMGILPSLIVFPVLNIAAYVFATLYEFSITSSEVNFVALMLVAGTLYLTPFYIAIKRHHPNILPIFLTSILLGWTVIGWLVAFIWSFTAISTKSESTE